MSEYAHEHVAEPSERVDVGESARNEDRIQVVVAVGGGGGERADVDGSLAAMTTR